MVQAVCRMPLERAMPLLTREQEAGRQAIVDALMDEEALEQYM